MSPRTYRLGRREAAVEETRDRVVDAARRVFSEDGFYDATLDDVAKRAGVARATVYYQFKSKFGLLEAAIDATIAAAPVDGLRGALEAPDAIDSLRGYIREICKLWARDRVFYRNVTGLAALDPEAQGAFDGYDLRRKEPLVFLGKRLGDQGVLRPQLSPKQATDAVWLLTNFRSFEHLTSRMKLSTGKASNAIASMTDGLLVPGARLA